MPRITLSDAVIEKLKKMIANLGPGDRLPPESELAQIFGVGRSSIREGLKAVSILGLVERKNEGTFVTKIADDCLVAPLNLLIQMDITNVKEVLEFREFLEYKLIDMAVEKITDDDFVIFEQLIWQMQKPGLTEGEFIEADTQFHAAIAKIADNGVMSELQKAVRTILTPFHFETCSNPKIQELTIDAHQKLLQSFKARNARNARKAMQEHLKVSKLFNTFVEN